MHIRNSGVVDKEIYSRFSIVGAAAIADVIDRDCHLFCDLVRDTYMSFGQGRAINPHSCFLSFSSIEAGSSKRIIALPAYLGGEVNLAGVKWVSSFPSNIGTGLPRASAVLILNDVDTGRPFACLEGSLISAARTAASAVLGAALLCGGNKSVRRLGFVGTGFISDSILQSFLRHNWKFEEIHLFDKVPGHSAQFASAASRVCESPIFISEDLGAMLAGMDMIVLATTATSPHILEVGKLRGDVKILNISLRDLSPEIILGAENIVDDIDHCLRANTSLHLAEMVSGSRKFFIKNIYECFDSNGEYLWSPSGGRAAIFSPFGLGVLDIALGSHVFREVCRSGQLRNIDGFFLQN
jgi:ornithine cyclodeaminase